MVGDGGRAGVDSGNGQPSDSSYTSGFAAARDELLREQSLCRAAVAVGGLRGTGGKVYEARNKGSDKPANGPSALQLPTLVNPPDSAAQSVNLDGLASTAGREVAAGVDSMPRNIPPVPHFAYPPTGEPLLGYADKDMACYEMVLLGSS